MIDRHNPNRVTPHVVNCLAFLANSAVLFAILEFMTRRPEPLDVILGFIASLLGLLGVMLYQLRAEVRRLQEVLQSSTLKTTSDGSRPSATDLGA